MAERTALGDKTVLISSLRKLTSDLSQKVASSRAKLHSTESIDHFLDRAKTDAMPHLFETRLLYFHCFSSLGVATRAELEEAWKAHYTDEDVRESVEDLFASEKKWEEYIDEIEAVFQKHQSTAPRAITAGSKVDLDLTLFIEAKSGNPVSLKHYLDQSPLTLLVLMRHFV